MSQRRQEARKAQQERRREERRQTRVQARRTQPTAPAAPGVKPARVVLTPARPARSNRLPLILAAIVGGLVVLALIAWLLWQQFKPLPGEQVESNGNAHVEQGQAHGAYFSNPPTSGWHLNPIPNPGIYTNPKLPEELGHFMEHGGVWVLYTCPDGCAELVEQLTRVVNNEIDRNKPVALAPYPAAGATPPERRINVVAWQRILSMDEFNGSQIEDFIERLSCRYNPEGPGWCGTVKGKVANDPKDAGENGFNAATPGPAPAAVPGLTPGPAGTSATPIAVTPPATAPTPGVSTAPAGIGPTPPR